MGERMMGRDLLESRIDDAIAKAERGSVARLSFLTPRERRQAERLLRARGAWEQAWFFGGYPTAERACLFLLPEYICAKGDAIKDVAFVANRQTVSEIYSYLKPFILSALTQGRCFAVDDGMGWLHSAGDGAA